VRDVFGSATPNSEFDVTNDAESARERFKRSQAATIGVDLAFAPGEHDAASRFLDLALETYDALEAAGHPPLYPFGFHSGESGRPPIASRELAMLANSLVRKWEAWRDEYRVVMSRQPRQALHEALRLISYSHDAASWPAGYELKILNWVESGNLMPMPLDDRLRIVTAEFYEDLRNLRQRSQGWLWFDRFANPTPHVIFVRDDQLAEWRRQRETEEAERLRKKEQAGRELERVLKPKRE